MQTQPSSVQVSDRPSGSADDETRTDELVDKAAREAAELADEAKQHVEEVTEDLLDTIADQLEDFAAQLRKQDLDSLFEHVRTTAERRPELFFAGSVATGLALARFAKASAQRRERADQRPFSEAGRQPRSTPPAPSARTSPPNLPSSSEPHDD